jgi:hypothetical protein
MVAMFTNVFFEEKVMAVQTLDFPNAASLKRLALSESGFIFDPVTGDSFTVNPTGLAILHLLQHSLDMGHITQELQAEFDIDVGTAERDILEFTGLLRGYFQ